MDTTRDRPTADQLGIRLYCAEQRMPIDALTEWPADVPLPMRLRLTETAVEIDRASRRDLAWQVFATLRGEMRGAQ